MKPAERAVFLHRHIQSVGVDPEIADAFGRFQADEVRHEAAGQMQTPKAGAEAEAVDGRVHIAVIGPGPVNLSVSRLCPADDGGITGDLTVDQKDISVALRDILGDRRAVRVSALPLGRTVFALRYFLTSSMMSMIRPGVLSVNEAPRPSPHRAAAVHRQKRVPG